MFQALQELQPAHVAVRHDGRMIIDVVLQIILAGAVFSNSVSIPPLFPSHMMQLYMYMNSISPSAGDVKFESPNIKILIFEVTFSLRDNTQQTRNNTFSTNSH